MSVLELQIQLFLGLFCLRILDRFGSLLSLGRMLLGPLTAVMQLPGRDPSTGSRLDHELHWDSGMEFIEYESSLVNCFPNESCEWSS
jgi:hypothetical protein